MGFRFQNSTFFRFEFIPLEGRNRSKGSQDFQHKLSIGTADHRGLVDLQMLETWFFFTTGKHVHQGLFERLGDTPDGGKCRVAVVPFDL